ncbi:MAG: CRISPR-associated endoribonuclease Cas6 [Candidatus Thermoplasmatota archaeon]|nr:CRISPR-associated endoribonuclease Cas6 [Candidatus Thermoplasmatota archaeon]
MLSLVKDSRIPLHFQYNYDLGIAIYDKLMVYQDKVKPLHKKSQQGLHTLSSLIIKDHTISKDGFEFQTASLVVRSLDDMLIEFLKLGISMDQYLSLQKVKLRVTGTRITEEPNFNSGHTSFKSLSPILVRNFETKNKFIFEKEGLDENLVNGMLWAYNNYNNKTEKDLHIHLSEAKRKTITVSNSGQQLFAWLLRGEIHGNPDVLKFAYYKGLGSKTALGLGCWEAFNGSN